LKSKLADFLKSGKDWERKPTTVPGVFAELTFIDQDKKALGVTNFNKTGGA